VSEAVSLLGQQYAAAQGEKESLELRIETCKLQLYRVD